MPTTPPQGAGVSWHQSTMPHSGCDRSPIRQLRPLCRYSWHCSDPVRTCLTQLPPLCYQLLVLPLLQDPRQAWGQLSDAVQTLTRTRPPSAGPSALHRVKRGGQYDQQQPSHRPLAPLYAGAFSAGLKGFQGQLLRPTPCSPVPGNSNPPLFFPDSGRDDDFSDLLVHVIAPPFAYKRRRQAHPSIIIHATRKTHSFIHPRYWHLPQSL